MEHSIALPPQDIYKLESLEKFALLDAEQQIMLRSVFGGFRLHEAAKLMAFSENQTYYSQNR